MPLSLPELLDLEARLHADRDEDPGALHERDRALGVPVEGRSRRDVLADWLLALRDEGHGPSVGERLLRATRLLRVLLVVGGFGIGWGVAAALLVYDGQQPINVLSYLAVAVVLQVLSVVVAVLGLAAWRWAPGLYRAVPLLDDLRTGVGWALERLADRLGRPADEKVVRLRDVLHRLRARRKLYARLEGWLAFGLVQALGIAFNVGLLACTLRLVALSDLAFAWSTTLEVGADLMHSIVQAIAAPWAWLVPSAVPDLSLVEATRFSRFEGAFTAARGAALAGAWWRFLVAATVTWGLLPRLLLWAAGRWSLARNLRRLPLDSPDVERVVRRLETPRVAGHPEPGAEEDGALPAEPYAHPAGAATRTAHGIRWGGFPGGDDALARAVRRATGASVAGFRRAGGRDYREDLADLESLETAEDVEMVVLVAEAFEEPDRALRRFLEDIRARVGDTVPVVVALAGEIAGDQVEPPYPGDVSRWRRMVGTMTDPYLDVQPLGEGP
ncbi:MAG: DUF2868 domain-containing protein [Myxococcota bacterium]